MSLNMYDAIHQSRKAAFTLLYWVKHFKQGLCNPLSANSDQQQFSPNNIHTLARDKVMRINKMINVEKTPWSFIKFSQLILKGDVWRSVWRICIWILGLKGLITYLFWIFFDSKQTFSVINYAVNVLHLIPTLVSALQTQFLKFHCFFLFLRLLGLQTADYCAVEVQTAPSKYVY